MGGSRTIHAAVVGRLRRGWPRALVVLLLACWLVQGAAVRTHLHFVAQARLTASPTAPATVLAKGAQGDTTAVCPLCEEMAMAGAYLLPAAIVLPPPPVPILWTTDPAIAEFRLPARGPGWLSRAPPE